jgi:hypothetical protein
MPISHISNPSNLAPGNEEFETTPLLQAAATSTSQPESQPIDIGSPRPRFALVFALSIFLCLVADLGGSIVDFPEIRLIEMAVCRDYYRLHDPSVIGPPPLSYVDEERCKLDEIQSNLVYLRTAKDMLMMLPGKPENPLSPPLISVAKFIKGLVLGLAYGKLADKVGRKPILFLGLLGSILAFLWVLVVCKYPFREISQ